MQELRFATELEPTVEESRAWEDYLAQNLGVTRYYL